MLDYIKDKFSNYKLEFLNIGGAIKPDDIDINKLEEKPTFKEFIGAFGNAIESDEVDNVLEVNSYSDFERTSTLRLDEKEKGYAKKI